jgi:hypothetical protein
MTKSTRRPRLLKAKKRPAGAELHGAPRSDTGGGRAERDGRWLGRSETGTSGGGATRALAGAEQHERQRGGATRAGAGPAGGARLLDLDFGRGGAFWDLGLVSGG